MDAFYSDVIARVIARRRAPGSRRVRYAWPNEQGLDEEAIGLRSGLVARALLTPVTIRPVRQAHNGLIATAFTAVGLYVVRMQPWQREGWLFAVTGVVHAVMFFGRQYGLHHPLLPGAAWIGWLGVWPLPLSIAITGWTLMAFPDGRLPSRRWRIPLAAMLAVAAVMALLSALWPTEYDRIGLVAPHPLNLSGGQTVATA